ncbi:MAG: TIGR04255 family protein [bacterium]|nr:TIGR04255 family protein [bacterium]
MEVDFPTVEPRRSIGVGVQAEQGVSSPVIITEERTLFVSKDRTQLIQVGPGLLVTNQLKPYNDYQSFRTFSQETMDNYYKVAKPDGLRRIGLRYINRIEITSGQSLEDVFHIGFNIPKRFQDFPNPYLLRMEFPYYEGRDRLVVIFATAPAQENSQEAAMLDLEYILVQPDEEIKAKPIEWVDEAHEKIEEVFHACLTESIIATFEPEEV